MSNKFECALGCHDLICLKNFREQAIQLVPIKQCRMCKKVWIRIHNHDDSFDCVYKEFMPPMDFDLSEYKYTTLVSINEDYSWENFLRALEAENTYFIKREHK